MISKDEILAKSKFNIETILGNVTFRYITVNDINILSKYLKEYDDELFAKMFIVNQVKDPNLSVEILNKYTEDEIKKIITPFIEKDKNLNKYFNYNTNDSFYACFKNGIQSYIKEHYVSNVYLHCIKTIKEHETNILSVLNQIRLNYYQNIKNALLFRNQMEKEINSMLSRQLEIYKNQSAYPYLNSLKRYNEFKEHVDYRLKLFYENKEYIKNVAKLITTFENIKNKYNLTSEEFTVLMNKHWFISPNMNPKIYLNVKKACETKERKTKQFNEIFNSYFLENNCENLDNLVKNWGTNKLFKPRMKIFKDCLNIIKNTPQNVNFANLVVPTLISQIDGIQNDFIIKYCQKQTELTDSTKKKGMAKKEFYKELDLNEEFAEIINRIFLDILFQNTYPGEDYSGPIHFSRHKILHGENIYYGRKDYVWRCFMLLDLLFELSNTNLN